MEQKWQRLGQAFRAARKRAGLTQVEVATAIGVSRTPVQSIERGVEWDKITGTMRSYARLVDWTDDSIETVLAGGDPTYRADAESGPSGRQAADLPALILDEMAEGRLISAEVIELPGSNARMTVVVRAPDASPDEIRRDLLAWRRARRHLQDMGDAEDDDTPEGTPDQA